MQCDQKRIISVRCDQAQSNATDSCSAFIDQIKVCIANTEFINGRAYTQNFKYTYIFIIKQLNIN